MVIVNCIFTNLVVVPNVAESRVLESSGDQQWVFHRLRFPILFADLNYVIRSTYSGSNPEGGSEQVCEVTLPVPTSTIRGSLPSSGCSSW